MKQKDLFGKSQKVDVGLKKEKKEPTGLKINRLSYSSIRDYMRCPKLFYYKYIMNLRIPQKQMELVFGGAVHEALEYVYKGQDPFEVFKRSFDKTKLLPEEHELYDQYVQEGQRLLEAYTRDYPRFAAEFKIDPEGESEVKFMDWIIDPITKDVLELKLSGRIDRLTTSTQIIEYKTSSKPYVQEDVDVELQASLYALQQLTKTKTVPPDIFYIVLVKGRKDPIQVLRTYRTKQQMSFAFRLVQFVLSGIKMNHFPKGSGWNHKWCDCEKFEQQLLL